MSASLDRAAPKGKKRTGKGAFISPACSSKGKISKTVSRVMSRIIIYLVLLLPAVSSDLPESRPGKPVALCLVLLRMGFTCAPPVARRAVVSYAAFPPLPGLPPKECSFPPKAGRFISVALALESPPPDVIRHPALRSPDFPHLPPPEGNADSRDYSSYLFSFPYYTFFFSPWQVLNLPGITPA